MIYEYFLDFLYKIFKNNQMDDVNINSESMKNVQITDIILNEIFQRADLETLSNCALVSI